ncbi:hypothetical protein [Bacillus sp. T33-2]|uniref:hypothetical protein n=1 Tax=Bacillus sp. T33-2 TaxID=2054168 RepID=UPI000C774F98|nr:hypothetical protein [Bacillus sp. T33-2]PLR91660.1 hypothetical protein CVD19_21580 [Bacillus sp. T33-2]
MRFKGNSKRVEKPNFWPKYSQNVPIELKDMVYQQYFCEDSLFIYCDMSMNNQSHLMSVACCYVHSGKVQVKQQLVYPPSDCVNKNIFGEFKAIIFALTHFEKYAASCKNVIIYSDIRQIEEYLNRDTKFKKNPSLIKIQSELISLYVGKKQRFPHKSITVQYLPHDHKAFNPFFKAAHNGAKRLSNSN